MQFEGTAFPPKSSERHQARLDVAQANSLSLVVADDIFSCDQQHADITAPVGNLPVRLKLDLLFASNHRDTSSVRSVTKTQPLASLN
ncbi:MAG: hypothetical protein AAGJ57_10995, partial [Pseudomonadota bacterium]